MIQQLAAVEILFHVGAHAFYPRPSVTSTVMRLAPRTAPLAPVRDARRFEALVRAAFGTRRKMLRGALAPAFGEAQARAALSAAGIDGTRRAESLSVPEFARLADALEEGGDA
jgi:16S rRNA (adenine1518-N6/adenine1519-N6)-dimethyltransferase